MQIQAHPSPAASIPDSTATSFVTPSCHTYRLHSWLGATPFFDFAVPGGGAVRGAIPEHPISDEVNVGAVFACTDDDTLHTRGFPAICGC